MSFLYNLYPWVLFIGLPIFLMYKAAKHLYIYINNKYSNKETKPQDETNFYLFIILILLLALLDKFKL